MLTAKVKAPIAFAPPQSIKIKWHGADFPLSTADNARLGVGLNPLI